MACIDCGEDQFYPPFPDPDELPCPDCNCPEQLESGKECRDGKIYDCVDEVEEEEVFEIFINHPRHCNEEWEVAAPPRGCTIFNIRVMGVVCE